MTTESILELKIRIKKFEKILFETLTIESISMPSSSNN